MDIRKGTRAGLVLALAAVVGGGAALSHAADAAHEVTRTVLLRSDLDQAGREAVMVAVEVPAGAAEGLHSHPAELFAFVQQGEVALELEGQPTRAYHAGEVLHVPAGKIHQAINHGAVTAKISAFFIAPKGQALTVPVAAPKP